MTSQLLDITQAATVRDNALGQLGHERSATAVARASLEAKTTVEPMKPHGDRPGGQAHVALGMYDPRVGSRCIVAHPRNLAGTQSGINRGLLLAYVWSSNGS